MVCKDLAADSPRSASMRYISISSSRAASRPTRVSPVPIWAITTMRSKPLARRRKSVTTLLWPLRPTSEATTVRSPNQCRARSSGAATSTALPLSMTSSIAASVRPGMLRSHA
jgi:hypothetical protein